MKESNIYVGLNDSVQLKQLFAEEKYIKVLKHVCTNYQVPFSFQIINGGYYHETGEFTHENTLLVILNNIDNEIVEEIAKDLCVFFHQESVLVTYSSKRRTRIVTESIE